MNLSRPQMLALVCAHLGLLRRDANHPYRPVALVPPRGHTGSVSVPLRLQKRTVDRLFALGLIEVGERVRFTVQLNATDKGREVLAAERADCPWYLYQNGLAAPGPCIHGCEAVGEQVCEALGPLRPSVLR